MNLNIKKMLSGAAVLLLIITVLIPSAFAEDYGAEGAADMEVFSLEEMLNYALEDEYLARGEYELIINEYGSQRPFSNIIKAEEYHISLLKPLFEKYGFELTEDKSEEYIVLPESIEASFQTGIDAEIANIEMYERFLEKDIPEDIRTVFEVLKRGSENHLKAFKNGLARNNGRGQGYKN